MKVSEKRDGRRYFLYSPGQENQFMLYFTPCLGFLKVFVLPTVYYTPSTIRDRIHSHVSVLVEKMPKMAILRDKLKDFEKTKRSKSMKWYFLHSPGQEEQFLYPLPRVSKKFCSTPCYYTSPTIRNMRFVIYTKTHLSDKFSVSFNTQGLFTEHFSKKIITLEGEVRENLIVMYGLCYFRLKVEYRNLWKMNQLIRI